MKKKAMALVMAAATAISLMAGSLSVSAATDPDTSAEKKIKVLSIWAEDSADGKILTGMLDNYTKDVNPNFSYEYEYVSASDLSTKISTLVASNDLPDLFAYSAGVPLRELIQAGKVVNVSEELKAMGDEDKVMDSAKSIMTSLSDTDDLYDLPFGMNIEGFWYNKSVFEDAGVEVPTTWDELLQVCDTLKEKGIQPIATGGSDKWPTTRIVNAYAYRTMGADAVKKACEGETKFTDDGFVAAAQMVADMADKGYFGEGATTVDNTTAEGMLLNGQCAMLYDGSWFTSSITDEETNPSGEDNIGFMGVPVVDESVSEASELPAVGVALCGYVHHREVRSFSAVYRLCEQDKPRACPEYREPAADKPAQRLHESKLTKQLSLYSALAAGDYETVHRLADILELAYLEAFSTQAGEHFLMLDECALQR